MKRFLSLFLLVAAAAASASADPAFPFTYYLHDTTGTVGDIPFTSIYQFPATPLGSSSHIVLKAVNTSSAPAFMGDIGITISADSTVANSNYIVSALSENTPVAVGGSVVFQVSFSPVILGPITAYMQTSYQIQQSGCAFTSTDPTTQCPSGLNLSATLTGTSTQPQLVLTYLSSTGSTLLQPDAVPINFGNISTSATSPLTFTLSNQSSVTVNLPSITVPAPTVYTASPFVLDLSQLPQTLAAGTSANFTVTFEPGQTGLVTTSLVVGSNSYPIQGEGVIVADIDALQISYVDNTGVRGLPQAATPISFGQLVAGTSGSNVLTFTVTNPTTSFNPVTVPSLAVSGSSFTLGGLTGASRFPAALAPGASLGFTITFTPTSSGNSTGILAIGNRVFSLAGLAINSPIPNFTLSVNPSPLNSAEQATVAVQLSAASPIDLTGTIALSFASSLTGVTDDPAIQFLALSGRTLPISVASGSQAATYNGQSALSFQTGTTAGTITFTVTFPNTPVYTQSFTITPSIVQITSASAVPSNPNLVVSVAGYDNSYSAGLLSFTFYDTSGKEIAPVSVDATGNFIQLFFNNNTAGGAFSLTATFPVTGDITKIGSVGIGVNNSVGQANVTQTVQ